MNTKLTVAIPVYNGEQYILEALQSIVDQHAKVDQILICDNCSTDNTIEVIQRFFGQLKGETETKIHVNNENIGALRNFNKCIELCETDYLLMLHTDDKLKKDGLVKQLEFYKKHPDFAAVGGKVDGMDENGKIFLKAAVTPDMIFQKGEIMEFVSKTYLWIQPATVMLNMKYREQIGYIDGTYIGGDERFWASILLHHPIAVLGCPVIDQRVHLGQGGTREHLRYKDKILHFEKNLEVANLESSPERIRKTRKLILNWVASQSIAVSHSVNKNFGETRLAIKYWLYGLRKNPVHYFKRYVLSKVKKPVKRILNR